MENKPIPCTHLTDGKFIIQISTKDVKQKTLLMEIDVKGRMFMIIHHFHLPENSNNLKINF